jgi:DNA-binding transcriptional LysR family regulator
MKRVALSDLLAFAGVAETRNFRRAAGRNGTSASSPSDALHCLQARLRVGLLTQTRPVATPSAAGAKLLARLQLALQEISTMLNEVKGADDAPSGMRHLNVPTVAGRILLQPFVARFMQAYCAISSKVSAKDSHVDVCNEDLAAGVRYDERLQLDMIAVPVGTPIGHFAAVASPAYLAARGMPNHTEELPQHQCIRHRFLSGGMPAWECERGGKIVRMDPPACRVTNSADMARAAVLAGLGIMWSFSELLQDEVKAGALEPIPADWSPPPRRSFPLLSEGQAHAAAPQGSCGFHHGRKLKGAASWLA